MAKTLIKHYHSSVGGIMENMQKYVVDEQFIKKIEEILYKNSELKIKFEKHIQKYKSIK